MTRRRPNERQGRFAEEYVAEEYDLEHRPDETEWYDCVNPRTGTKYEVKSTHRELDTGALGRFRLWRDQHRSFVAIDASGVAWYAFVLLDSSGDVVGVVRRKPSTMTRIVDGWNQAGHQGRIGRQRKIQWTEIHTASSHF